MVENSFTTALEEIATRVEINNTKQYWMVRTDNGSNYETFAEGGFIALNLRNYPTQFLSQIEQDYPNINERTPYIKQALIEAYRNGLIRLNCIEGDTAFNSNIGRLAKQILSLAYKMKEGDIVLIPDHEAKRIKIGK